MSPLAPIKTYRKSIAVFLTFLMLFSLSTNIFQTTTINAKEETADDAATIVEITTTSGIIRQASGSNYIEALSTLRQTLQQSDNIEKIRVIKGKITNTEWVNILKNPSPYFIIDKEVNAEEMPIPTEEPLYYRKIKEFRTYANLPNISNYAFRYCDSLETVDLSAGVSIIGSYAFFTCINLRQIILPDNLKTIGSNAFARCEALTEIHLPESLESIGFAAFSTCSALRTVTIPTGVTTIGANAFSSCSMLEEVKIPEDTKLNTIADNTFLNCKKLKHITIPDNIKTIGQSAFSGCEDLESVTLPNGIRFDSGSFRDCKKLDTLNIIVKEGKITSADIIAPMGNNVEAFTNLPEPRTLAFYTEDGTPLSDTTTPTIRDAMNAYAAYDDGNMTDEKWYGWNIVRAFSINNKLTNIISSNSATSHRPSTGEYTTTLSVDDYTNPLKKFTLPETISVTIGTSPAIAGVHYTYDSTTGKLTIPAEYIKGDITIKADATDITDYYIQIQSTGTGTTKLYVNSKETSWDSAVKVKNNDKVVLVFLADEGSVVESLLVNGTSQTITEPAGFSHPLDINEHYIISVTYSEDTAPTPTTNPTASPSPAPDIPSPTPSPTVSPSPTPDIPTPTPPVPTTSPSPAPDIPSTTPPSSTTSPTIKPNPVPSSTPTTSPTAAPTQTPGVSISDLMSGLGVSEETAVKIQKAADELDVSKDTLLVTDETITSQKTDDDIKGAYYSRIQAQAAQTSEKDIRLTWNRVKGADGYRIYSNYCNTRKHIYEYKLTKTIQNGNKKSYVQRKCKKGTFYKFIVRAYKVIDGKKVTIAVSKTIHATTIGGKYGNAESVKLKKNKASLMAGKTFRIKAKEIKKNKPLRHHREIKYESNNPKVATVSEKGVVTAKKAGVCTIYAYAQNGRYKKTTIKVKVRK